VLYLLFYFFQLFFGSYYCYCFFFLGHGEGKNLLRCARSGHLAKLGEQIFGLKIHRLDLQARALPSVLYTKTVVKDFSAHSIAFNHVLCVLFYWVAHGHV
jgi:hypothetical protein